MPESSRDRANRLVQAEWWLENVWGGQAGFACCSLGTGGHFVGRSYKFDGWSQSFEPWPPQRDRLKRLATRLVDASCLDDVYVAPLLRSSLERRKANGLPGRFLYADLDQTPLDAQRRLLTRLVSRGHSFTVSSGSGVHAYVEIEAGLDLADFEELNRRLAMGLGGDAKWDTAAVLRLPGTFNHKERARGRVSTPVVLRGAP